MLPVSIDQLITQPVQYHRNAPPFVFEYTNLLPEAYPLVVFASADVANEASRYAQNSVTRLFCFNLLASNNYNNEFFAEAVRMSLNLAILKHRQGEAASPYDALPQAVSQILSLYASALALNYPEVTARLAPQQVEAIRSNVQVYNSLRAAMDSMYQAAAVPPYQPSGMISRQPQMPMVSRGSVASHPAGQTSMAPLVRQPMGTPPSAYSGRPAVTPPAAPPPQAPSVPKNILEGEIEKMDRDAHTVIYFGKKVPTATSVLREQFQSAIEKQEGYGWAENFDQLLDQPFINLHDVKISPSLDELVMDIQMKCLLKAEEPVRIYSMQGTVVQPVISSVDLAPVFKRLVQSTNFTDMANILNEEVEKAKADKSLLRATLTYVSQLDKELTKLMNDFLLYQCGLNNPPVEITSFVEDAPNVGRFLNEKYKGQFNNAFQRFQTAASRELFKMSKQAAVPTKEGEEIPSLLSDEPVVEVLDDLPEGAYYDQYGIRYHIVFITATSQELGYKTSTKNAKLVTESTPMLHRLLTAIQTQNQLARRFPMRQLLITADGRRYAFFPVVSKQGQFNLLEV